MSDETPKPWVTMSHPEAGTAVSSRVGFDDVWAEKGWTVVEEHELNPNEGADGDLEDALADNSATAEAAADETPSRGRRRGGDETEPAEAAPAPEGA